mmetsp:Transcript_19099/g.24698  ORF Transcript_19099/g.24698 Transcript_19099/m.24698 type:complete len:81 (+) Transcript_19099:99-341(+)
MIYFNIGKVIHQARQEHFYYCDEDQLFSWYISQESKSDCHGGFQSIHDNVQVIPPYLEVTQYYFQITIVPSGGAHLIQLQ